MAGSGTSEGRFIIELDGVSAVRAMEVSGLKYTHEEFELHESNKPNPHVGRGHFKIEPVTIKQGSALNEAGRELFEWLRLFTLGTPVERRNMRVIQLDEDGTTPVEIYELYECVPTSFSPDNKTAGGKNPSSFSFTVRPTDMEML